MDTVIITKRLPNSLIIRSADSHLYRIGLLWTPVGDCKRGVFYHPLLIFVVLCVLLTKNVITTFVAGKDIRSSIVLGNASRLSGLGNLVNHGISLCIVLALCSQIIYYVNHKNRVKPTFLRPFHMMSGRLTPEEVGLHCTAQCVALVNKTRLLFRLIRMASEMLNHLCAIGWVMTSYLLNGSVGEAVAYGVPYTALYIVGNHYYFNIIFYQMVYFYITCDFFKIKIRQNKRLALNEIRVNSKASIGRIIAQFNGLYSEIREYDRQLWSRFLLCYWATFGSIVTVVLFITLFIPAHLILKVIFGYIVVLFGALFILIIFTAASINKEMNEFHPIFNRMYLQYALVNSINKNKSFVSNKIKVKINSYIGTSHTRGGQ